MKLNLTPIFTARYWTLLSSILLLALVSACGGGNGGAGTPIGGSGSGSNGSGSGTTPVTSNGAITITLATSTGAASNTIPAGGNLVATAKVVNAAGSAVPNALVTFATTGTQGVLPITSALTDSSGAAVVSLQAGTTSGAASITATATVVGTTAITATANFQSAVTGSSSSPSIVIALASSAGCTAKTVTAACPITVNATVTDASGHPVTGTIVSFANSLSLTGLTPLSGSVITNSMGIATVTLAPVGLPTPANNGTAGTMNASTSIGGVTVSAAATYTLGNTNISVVLNTPASGSATVNAYGTTTIAVQVNSNSVKYTAQPVTVNFTSGCTASGTAALPASATTVNGIAQVTYTDMGCGATDTVTASVAGASASVTVALNVTAPTPTAINFISATPSDQSIVLPGTGGTGRASTATLTFKLVDTRGNPINGGVVNFTNNNSAVATLNATSGTTAADGTVSATVTAVAVGTFAITATLNSAGSIYAISNSVIVSTGLPVQASFTLAASIFNIEGWNYAGTQSTLTAFIADASGNPVVNGTPVVATTDEGSVGNVSGVSAGCTTVNGQCTVNFTSQNPKCILNSSGSCGYIASGTPASQFGIAKVNFTSTNNTTVPLNGSLYVYMSAGDPYYYSNSSGPWTFVTGGNSPPGVITSSVCSPNISLIIADINGNPPPFQTTIAVTTTVPGVTLGAPFPTSVSNISPPANSVNNIVVLGGFAVTPGHYTSGQVINGNSVVNGQPLTIPITLAAPAALCKSVLNTTMSSFTFQIETTTPKGVAILNNFTYNYPTN